ncbi:gephyrin-like molybdotransferase Glp [Microbaculum marinisediminis]|uniref:Molybdopterin molybdenumtransferase n=1 Tax=Microbaculum marinisediminis TaxID=2931392 RepID=A0AAW5R308_9HYPH|nr:gephyrin-like molybdotransferase Glp [Microbaculum sp. A6E488]MCT8974358.1 molybdopterin molybdotransferase MoeA [Microbaculum sp. A6E488]
MALLPVEEALRRIVDGVPPRPAERVPLDDALDRVLAEDIAARRTQPPWDTSAMDGYAVRAADVATVPTTLRVIGAAPAGHPFEGTVGAGEAVRIFTGAPLPDGANAIVIQEDTERAGDEVTVLESSGIGRFVRKRGLDFAEGDVLLSAGRRADPRAIALAAAMNHADLSVHGRPKVAILSTGDELALPGSDPGPEKIIASNGFGLAAIVRRAGGIPVDLGIAADDRESLAGAVAKARKSGADVLVTLGGASVGEHDIVQDVLVAEGLSLDFWKIAMRPGKPLMFGMFGASRFLGLPGNPVSAMITARLFLVPLIHALCGLRETQSGETNARLGADLGENDQRQDYLRAMSSIDPDGTLVVTPFGRQDSSMLATLARADALIIRPPFAPAATAGETCRALLMDF